MISFILSINYQKMNFEVKCSYQSISEISFFVVLDVNFILFQLINYSNKSRYNCISKIETYFHPLRSPLNHRNAKYTSNFLRISFLQNCLKHESFDDLMMMNRSTCCPGDEFDLSRLAFQDKILTIEFIAGAIGEQLLDQIIFIYFAVMQSVHEILTDIEGSVLSSRIESPVVVAASKIEATVVEVEDDAVELLVVEVVLHHDEDMTIEGLIWICGKDHLMFLDLQLLCEDKEEGYENKFHFFNQIFSKNTLKHKRFLSCIWLTFQRVFFKLKSQTF